jgi:hypothetical protein
MTRRNIWARPTSPARPPAGSTRSAGRRKPRALHGIDRLAPPQSLQRPSADVDELNVAGENIDDDVVRGP